MRALLPGKGLLHKLTVVFAFFIFLIALTLFFYGLINYFVVLKKGASPLNEGKSPFAGYQMNQAAQSFKNYLYKLPSVADPNWTWEHSRVMGTIFSTDKDNSSVKMMITSPSDQSFSNTFRDVRLECPVEASALFSYPEFNYIKSGISVFDNIKKNSLFSAYCLDSDCKTLGKECIVIEK